MSSIQLYSNERFSVRTTTDANGTVWFVAKDIAEALEYSLDGGMGKYFTHVPDVWKGGKRIATVERGMQEMLCLTEQGVYFFLGRSDKPKALPYQMWIAGEVVPSIHATGSYSVKGNDVTANMIESAGVVFKSAGITGNQLTLALDKVYKSYTGRSALEAAGVELIAPVKSQLLTPTEIGKQFGLSAKKVNDILAGAGYQHKIENKWEPLGDGVPYAVMMDTGKKHTDGVPVRQLKWDSSILEVMERLLAQH